MRREKQLLLEQHRGMVLKLAWQYWRRLPSYTKIWVDPEDLIEEAYLYILSRAQGSYDRRRAGQSTFLWTGLTNLFLIFAMRQQTKKRFGWSVPLEELQALGKRDTGVGRVETIDAVLKCYQQASEECRQEMQKWFGFERIKVKRSEQAKRVYLEFKILAERNRLSPNDCRQLMRGGLCLR